MSYRSSFIVGLIGGLIIGALVLLMMAALDPSPFIIPDTQ